MFIAVLFQPLLIHLLTVTNVSWPSKHITTILQSKCITVSYFHHGTGKIGTGHPFWNCITKLHDLLWHFFVQLVTLRSHRNGKRKVKMYIIYIGKIELYLLERFSGTGQTGMQKVMLPMLGGGQL